MENDESRRVGHGCFAVIYSVRGESVLFLLGQRNEQTDSYPLWLELTGGSVEEGEDWRTGLIREVREETGICLSETEIAPFRTYRRPDQPLALINASLVRITDITVKSSSEWLGYVWVSPTQVVELQNLILAAHLRIIKDVFEAMGISATWNPERKTAWIDDGSVPHRSLGVW